MPTDTNSRKRILQDKRVLLAEDDPLTRMVMADVLRSMGAEVVESSDGGRMLVMVASQYKDGRSPTDLDLVVTDVEMPVVSGLDVLHVLRAAGWRTPLVIVTGCDSDDVRHAAERLGAVLLPKPLDLDTFERAVSALLAQHKTRAERRSVSSPSSSSMAAARDSSPHSA